MNLQFPPNTLMPGDEAFLRVGAVVSHGGRITKTQIREDGAVFHSFHVGGTDLEMHGVLARHFSPLTTTD